MGTRIDHIAVCVHPQNLVAAVQRFNDMLGIDLEGPYLLEMVNLVIYIDWDAGMEVVAPTETDGFPEAVTFLEQHGEGIFDVIFAVDDPDATTARLKALGVDVEMSSIFWINEAWRERFARMEEGVLADPVHGVKLLFGHFQRREPDQ